MKVVLIGLCKKVCSSEERNTEHQLVSRCAVPQPNTDAKILAKVDASKYMCAVMSIVLPDSALRRYRIRCNACTTVH